MNQDEKTIEILEDLIRIDSSNPFKSAHDHIHGNEIEIAEFLETKLKEAGFRVKRQYVHTGLNNKGKRTRFYNLVAEKGSGDNAILFYGHMDTVDIGSWSSREDALTPRRKMRDVLGQEKETIIALGAADMKASLAAMVTAFNELNPQKYKIKVAFGVDEEGSGLGAEVLAKSNFLDDVVAVICGEKGTGPNDGYGAGTICLGRFDYTKLVIKVPGTGGHGAYLNLDHTNAAIDCAKIALEIENLRKHSSQRCTFYRGKMPDAKAKGYLEACFSIGGIKTENNGYSIPQYGEVEVDYLLRPGDNVDGARKIIQKIVDQMYASGKLKEVNVSGSTKRATVELGKGTENMAYLTPANHPFTVYYRKVVDATVGFRNFSMGYSIADENTFATRRPNIPVLVSGPIGGDLHRAGEWVEIQSALNLRDVYREAAKNFMDYLGKRSDKK